MNMSECVVHVHTLMGIWGVQVVILLNILRIVQN